MQSCKGMKGNRILPTSALADYNLGAGPEGLERGETVWKYMERYVYT